MKALALLRETGAVASLVLLVLLVTSGWGLMASYAPSDQEAFASVLYLRQRSPSGAFLRALHHHAAAAVVVAGALYLLATYLSGLARERRAWWLALSVYLIVLVFCFSGFLLPMDQAAYWGTVVRLGIVESASFVGPPVAEVLRGGPTFNPATLPRFHALHVSILPFVLLLLLLPLVPAARAAIGSRPGRLLGLGALVLAAAYVWAALLPAPLEPRMAAGDADYVPRPEWYFLWLFQLGKYVPWAPWLRSLFLPAAGLLFLYAIPLLRSPSMAARARVAGAWCLAWLALTGLSRWEDRSLPRKPSYEEAQLAHAKHNYSEECQSCHGESGKGDGSQARAFGLKPRDFTNPGFWRETSDEKMREALRSGKGEDMPAFGKKLSEEDIDGLVAYVRRRFRPSGA